MKYEFHVGNYVETVDGFIGWVSYVDQNCITIKSNEGIISGPWSIPEEQYHFNRIGQYEFAKKDENKIEPLVKSWVLEDVDGKGEYNFDSREVIKKVNELVDVVNELKTDYEKHLRMHELTER